MKKCPYCAEKIQDEAIVCRYCGRDLIPPAAQSAPPAAAQPQPAVPVLPPAPASAQPPAVPAATVTSGKKVRVRVPPHLGWVNLALGLIGLAALALVLRPVFSPLEAASRKLRQDAFTARAERAERTLGANATATAEASYRRMTDPISTELWLIFGPETIVLPHNAEDDLVVGACPGFEGTRFMYEATYINPYPASEFSWDFGLIYLGDPDFRLAVQSNKTWELVQHNDTPSGGEKEFVRLSSGEISSLNTGADEKNTYRFIADGDTGYLTVNGVSYGAIDLSPIPGYNEICILTGSYLDDEITGKATRVENIKFWVFDRPRGGD